MSERKNLDIDCAYSIDAKADLAMHCRCGHSARMTPRTWKNFAMSSLYRIVDNARYTECGAVGEVPNIRLLPRRGGRRTKHKKRRRQHRCWRGARMGSTLQ